MLENNEIHRQERLYQFKALAGNSGYNQKAIKKSNEGTIFQGIGKVKGIQTAEETSGDLAMTRHCFQSWGGRITRTGL